MSAYQSSRQAPQPGRRFGRVTLTLLVVGYIIGAVLIWMDPVDSGAGGDGGPMTDLGTLIVLVDLVVILALDWRGFASLRGRIKLRQDVFSRITTWCLFLAFLIISPITLGIYLVLSIRDYRRERQQVPLDRQRHIAEMEAELGILPGTQGPCRTCGKPLQIGAEYCAFCGVTAVETPRICPACAAIALPGATFCPECRARLDTPTKDDNRWPV